MFYSFRAAVRCAFAAFAAAAGLAAGAERQLLEVAAQSLGFPAPTADGRAVVLCREDVVLSFAPGSRQFSFGGLLLHLNDAVQAQNGTWTVARADVDSVLAPMLMPSRALAGVTARTVVLDPGHGGGDSGAVGRRRVSEKRVVLDIARRVRLKLRDTGLAVTLTREGDDTLDLDERVAVARQARADLFVSIHINASGNGAGGIETFVLPAVGFASTAGGWTNRGGQRGSADGAANTLLGYYIHKGMLARTEAADRGVKRAGFQVLRQSPCPAVLVECGFVSNRREEEQLMQSLYRDALAEGIAQGILTFAGMCEQGRVEMAQSGHPVAPGSRAAAKP